MGGVWMNSLRSMKRRRGARGAGLLLLLSWLQNRNVRGLALWASALLTGSIGVARLRSCVFMAI